MAAKVTIICAFALLVQSAYSGCLGGVGAPYGLAGTSCGYNGLAGTGCGYNGLAGSGCGYNGFGAPGLGFDGFAAPFEGAGFGCGGVASTGGGLPCASASPIPPVGVSVLSENAYEGALAVGGNMPFLGTVALEGVLPTAGAGAVSYGCGSGACGIAAEDGAIATGIAPHAPGPYGYGAYGPGLGAAGYDGLGGFGCGFGGIGFGAGCGCGGIY